MKIIIYLLILLFSFFYIGCDSPTEPNIPKYEIIEMPDIIDDGVYTRGPLEEGRHDAVEIRNKKFYSIKFIYNNKPQFITGFDCIRSKYTDKNLSAYITKNKYAIGEDVVDIIYLFIISDNTVRITIDFCNDAGQIRNKEIGYFKKW